MAKQKEKAPPKAKGAKLNLDLGVDLETPQEFALDVFDATFGVRPLWPAKTRELRKAAGLSAYAHVGEELDDDQQAALNAEMVDWLVAWWKGPRRGGVDLACTRETKLELVDRVEVLALALPKWGHAAYVAAMVRASEAGPGNWQGSSDGRVTALPTSSMSAAPAATEEPSASGGKPGPA